MTEGQIKYQTLMENQRHNLELERQGAVDVESRREQAVAATQQAATRQAELDWQKLIDDYAKPAERAKNIGTAIEQFSKGFHRWLSPLGSLLGGITG